jgi:predicted RNA-binding protein YlxR (DUF448 family)
MLAASDLDLDDGPRTTKSGAERMCAVTRQVRPVDELLRFVVGPDGGVLADLKRKLPGRGLWISASREAVSEAVRRGVFGRGFKRDVRVPPDLVDATEAMLVRGVADALAMAGKARQVIAGFAKVEAALRGGEAVALLHAADGAPDGIRKLDATARQNAGAAGEIPIFTSLSSTQLDLALGRTNVIHAALRAGAAADTAVARCRGLVRFRAGPARREAAASSVQTSGDRTPETAIGVAGASVTEPGGVDAPGIEASAIGASRHSDV